MNGVKLTKKIDAELKKRAAKLPACNYEYIAHRSGSELIAAKVERNKNDELINPDKTYESTEFRDANHFRRMKTIFRNDGWAGIEEYEKAIRQMGLDGVEEMKALLKKKYWFKLWLNKVIAFFKKVFNFRKWKKIIR